MFSKNMHQTNMSPRIKHRLTYDSEVWVGASGGAGGQATSVLRGTGTWEAAAEEQNFHGSGIGFGI